MRRLVCIALALAACGLSLAPGGAGASPRRPDLVVSKGAVALKHGQLAGSFVVRNAGRAGSRRTSAALTAKGSGKTRVIKRFGVPALGRAKSLRVKVAIKVPSGLPAGSLALRVCADAREVARERSERNNCRRVGRLEIGVQRPPPPPAPGDPEPDKVLTFDSPASRYWAYPPDSYDKTTPTALLVWLHGCNGYGAGDIYTVAPSGDQRYIAIAVGGRENDCWKVEIDTPTVLAAIADAKTHFNIDPRRVVLGGYSSGGDLAYRIAFYNAKLFAGVLAENTSPFQDTGSMQSDSIAAADWKFNIVQLAHTEDATYAIGSVRAEINALKAAGFPVTLIERPGTHYDDDTATTGTDHDLRTLLLPHMDDSWLAPGP
jgi:hypothetical protein